MTACTCNCRKQGHTHSCPCNSGTKNSCSGTQQRTHEKKHASEHKNAPHRDGNEHLKNKKQ